MLAWIDLETTGLEFNRDKIVEIAVVVTDDSLNELAHFSTPVFQDVNIPMSPKVMAMHTHNGLFKEIRSGKALGEELAQAVVCTTIERAAEEHYGEVPMVLAGSSVGFDRSFINWQMPHLRRLLHYRTVDVSSYREMIQRWGLPVYPKQEYHRALDDIRQSVDELRDYRRRFFNLDVSVPQ